MTEQAKKFTLSLVAYAAQRGIAVEDLCTSAGVNISTSSPNSLSEISSENADKLWKHASQLCNDPLFGLHFGESLQISALGAVGEIIKSSDTVGEALEIALSLVPLVTDRFTMQLSTSQKNFNIYVIPKKDIDSLQFVDEQIADFLLAFTIHELDGLMLRTVKPIEVCLPKALPESSEYKRVFRCDQIKKEKEYSITINADLLETPILTANHQLQKLFLEKIKDAYSDLLSPKAAFNKRIYNYLISNAYLSVPSLEDAASNFNISPRTLQRRLKEEGKTFQQIANSVKKHLAITYMKTEKYPIKEISYILGYNDLSAFSRAFRRWTGKAPIYFN